MMEIVSNHLNIMTLKINELEKKMKSSEIPHISVIEKEISELKEQISALSLTTQKSVVIPVSEKKLIETVIIAKVESILNKKIESMIPSIIFKIEQKVGFLVSEELAANRASAALIPSSNVPVLNKKGTIAIAKKVNVDIINTDIPPLVILPKIKIIDTTTA